MRLRRRELLAAVGGGVLLARRGHAQISVLDPARRRVDQPVPAPPPVIEVGRAKHLFVDDWLVAENRGLRRTLHPIRKHPSNPLLSPVEPWEKPSVLLYGSVIYDPARDSDRFRMWYLCYTPGYSPDFSGDGEKGGCVAYAISRDGLQWERPRLGLHDFAGSKANNIVIPGVYGFACLHFDPRDSDPARRYKAMTREPGGHIAYFSPDGLRWTRWGTVPLDGYDRSSIHWDPVRRKWAASTKQWYVDTPGQPDRRGRGYQESDDWRTWSPAAFMAGTPTSAPDIVYALEAFYYESLFLGWWGRYTQEPDGLLDLQLAVSRNGRHWERPSPEPIVPLTGLPVGYIRRKRPRTPDTGVDPLDPRVPWDYGNNSASTIGPVRVGDELRIYYSGRTSDHRSRPQTGAIGMGSLRLDGFISLDAGDEAATLLTRPLLLKHDNLRLNADARAGEIRVEVLDVEGKPIPPFTLKNCRPVTDDSVRHTVRWKDAADLSILRGKPVRLRLPLKRAQLYALWTGAERSWHSVDTTTWEND